MSRLRCRLLIWLTTKLGVAKISAPKWSTQYDDYLMYMMTYVKLRQCLIHHLTLLSGYWNPVTIEYSGEAKRCSVVMTTAVSAWSLPTYRQWRHISLWGREVCLLSHRFGFPVTRCSFPSNGVSDSTSHMHVRRTLTIWPGTGVPRDIICGSVDNKSPPTCPWKTLPAVN